MKSFRLNNFCWLSVIFLCALVARAQTPIPAPKPVDSQTRQKLRTAILETLGATDSYDINTRSNLALPLAQLGDWDTALRLLKNDVPRRDELWHWRAIQLASAGKWREVRAVAAHIQHVPTHADALLFAARTAIDSGVALNSPLDNSQELENLLLAASPLLEKSDNIPQRAYGGYLWARGGDTAAAKRVFARTIEVAKRADVAAITEFKKKHPQIKGNIPFHKSDNLRKVLSMQARAGLLLDALQHAESADDYLMSWWIAAARTPAEFTALYRVLEKLPAPQRVPQLFLLSMINGVRVNTTTGRTLFEQAQKLADSTPTMSAEQKYLSVMNAFFAAHFLQDAAAKTATMEKLRKLANQSSSAYLKLADIAVMPALVDLQSKEMLGDAAPQLSPARLDEIAVELQMAEPSDLQFRALETVATLYFQQNRNDKLKPVAQSLLKSARTLEDVERKERAQKEPSILNPYWSRSPRVLTAIFWLQRAGDQESAAAFAREFARSAPENEKPYAAMALLQIGFPQLADSVFDPVQEFPRIALLRREDWKKKRVDWSLFMSWDEFAATEARFRSPDAPFRWLEKLDNSAARASVLREWVAALYPAPVPKPPFVNVTLGRSSSSI